jgi:hypothetical protein
VINPLYKKSAAIISNDQPQHKLFSYKSLQERLIFLKWTVNQWFENFIYLLILISMILLTLDNPMNDPNLDKTKVIAKIDYWITILFCMEAICRIIALGFLHSSIPNRKGYIHNGSNQIDFIVCVSSLILLVIEQTDMGANYQGVVDAKTLKSLKVLRSIRALRLLRVIS